MAAFDGDSDKVNVYFDDDSGNILLSLTDDPANRVNEHAIKIRPDDVEQIVKDLLAAHYIRTGKRVRVDYNLADS